MDMFLYQDSTIHTRIFRVIELSFTVIAPIFFLQKTVFWKKKLKKFISVVKNQWINLKWKKDKLLDYLLNNSFLYQLINNSPALLLWKIKVFDLFFDVIYLMIYFQIFVISRNTKILIESNYCLGIYVPYILKFETNYYKIPKKNYPKDYNFQGSIRTPFEKVISFFVTIFNNLSGTPAKCYLSN